MIRKHAAFARADVLASLACTTLIASITTVAIAGHGQRTSAATLRDGNQLKQIHQSFVIFAREFRGRFPRPGLINRRPVELDGGLRDLPGRGDEDVTLNTTASLYSALIMQNYLTAEMVVSPVDRNPRVVPAQDYDYEKYDVGADVYWDDAFVADLERGSNASYAHLVMFGERVEREWRDGLNAAYPALGNRGPLDGEPDGRSYTCGPHGHWTGNVVFNDNHVNLLTTMTPEGLICTVDGEPRPDNIFAMETGPGGSDAVLSFTRRIDAGKPVLQHD